MLETDRIEFKEKLSDKQDFEKSVIAFLNHKGGTIFFGIDNSGKIVGVSDSDRNMLKIKDRIKNNILPSTMGVFDVLTEEREHKTIIKVSVAIGSEKPYFMKKFGMIEKGCFLRVGTSDEPIPQKMIEKLFASRTRNSIGTIRSNKQVLSFAQLHIYYQERNKNLNKHFRENLNLYTQEKDLNYVAYLLADENDISIRLAKYRGINKFNLIENKEYGLVSLVKSAERVLDRIEIENTTFARITYKERIENRLWNAGAIREAVLNAFVHNDYTREIGPTFEIYDDRIEITSAGSLPNELSESEFFEGYSIPRNRELMRVFKDLNLVEHLGLGVPKILRYYGRECFKFTDNFLRVKLPSAISIDKKKQESFSHSGLTNRQEKILQLILENPNVSKKELAEVIGISTTGIDKNLKILKEKGIIERVGKGRSSQLFYRKKIQDINQLSDTQKKIVQLIQSNSKISKKELAKAIGISTTGIDKNLKILKEKGIIRRVGKGRSSLLLHML